MRHRATLYAINGENSIRCTCAWEIGNLEIEELLEAGQRHVIEFTPDWVCLLADDIGNHIGDRLPDYGVAAQVAIDHEHDLPADDPIRISILIEEIGQAQALEFGEPA